MSWNSYDVNNGMPMGYGNNNGNWGNAAAAGLGALVGGAVGGAVMGNNGTNVAKEVAVGADAARATGDLQTTMFASSLAAADRGYQQTISFLNQGNAIDRDVLTTGYDTTVRMMEGFNQGNVVALSNKYDAALQMAALGYQQEKCCCKTSEDIMRMGYETQLRDQSNHGTIMAELLKTQCMIKDTEKDSIIRGQCEKIYSLENRLNKEEIIAAMKPVAPVPAYIQANPYENFRPVVRVAHDHHGHGGSGYCWPD